jgi:putative transposase
MEMDLPKRKHPRLNGYDYSRGGAYFVTICTKNRQCMLSRIVGRGILDAPIIELSEYGKNVDESIKFLNTKPNELHIEKYVIMPNHVHMLIVIDNGGDGGASRMPRPTNALLPKFISSIKRYTNKVCSSDLWQNSYYDHVIRDDHDYLTRWQYIDDNPARWAEDKYYTE